MTKNSFTDDEYEVNLLSVITALIFSVTLMMVVGAMLTMVAL